MSNTVTIGLTPAQRELLLSGLRFVRSSVTLEICEPTPEVVEKRDHRINEIENLVATLSGSQHAESTAGMP
jgi:hypothetical protein